MGSSLYQLKKNMITYIANTFLIVLILFFVFLIVMRIIYGNKPDEEFRGSSERQKKNEDYNDYFYP